MLSIAYSTFVFVTFEVHLTHGQVNPTGAGFREAILINGTFTGPTLRLNAGDRVEFLVRNRLRKDTTIHFHGISQSTSPWADGVPGVSQRPIRPGSSYLYRWKAEDPGVYFYHAHSRGQIMDGLYGAIIITPPKQADRPFHMISRDPVDYTAMREAETKLQTLMISDWSQFSFERFYGVEREANIDFTCMDSIIINGAGSQYCLDRQSLDNFTNPLVKAILASTGEKGITDKGCIPPLQLFQGNFSLHLDTLPLESYKKCTPGVGSLSNFTVPVHSGDKWAALTFINPGGLYPLKVTIDNHLLHVYAVDGQYIYPQKVDQLLVNNGERYSIFVKLDQQVGRYTIRIANELLGQVLGGFGALSYNGVMEDPPNPRALMNYAGQPLVPDIRRFSELDARPYPPVRPAAVPDQTHKLLVKKLGRPYGSYEWTLSGGRGYNVSEEDLEAPLLFQPPNRINSSELIVRTRKGDWVDLIIEIEGPFAQAHPMHKHGNKAFVIGQGVGSFPWASVNEAAKELPLSTFNTVDPPYKDTFKTLEAVNNNAWLVLRYKADFAGAWLFHCHIQTHLTGGMSIVLLDGVDHYPQVPEDYREWNGFEQPR
ncbi:multicopper oxidase [Melanomma pulvis-pyrius CBS 109.77]|uniref:Multicopper oxidase n=1 Tax=Melanomma pulvis-pyrius CBS 109.77 TaxID=1314802 RepID=A0A6A6XH55_9PLEO|nr:multicopper oxidase [Melanomma pulvis-pyrius CBS 109.77]